MDSRKYTGKKQLANGSPVPGTSSGDASPTEDRSLSRGSTQRITPKSRPKRVNVHGEDNEDDISELLDSFSDLLENPKGQESHEYTVTEPPSPRSEESLDVVIKDILTDDDLLEKCKPSRDTQNKGVPKRDVGLYLMRLDKVEKSVEWRTLPLGSSAAEANPASHVDVLFLSNRALKSNEGDRTAGCRRGQLDVETVNQEPMTAVNFDVPDIGTRAAPQPLRPKTRRGCFKKREPLGPRNDSRPHDESSGDKPCQAMMTDEQDAGTSAQFGFRENHERMSRSSQNNDQGNVPDIIADQQTKTPKRKRFSQFICKKFTGFKKKIESINCLSCSFTCCS